MRNPGTSRRGNSFIMRLNSGLPPPYERTGTAWPIRAGRFELVPFGNLDVLESFILFLDGDFVRSSPLGQLRP